MAKIVVDIAYKIHRKLGPGLFESVYQTVLIHELRKIEISVESEVPVPVVCDEVRLEIGFVADVIVDGKLILELKSLQQMSRIHEKQLLTYLRLTNCRLGLLINFGAELIRDGITRVVNGLTE